MGCIELGSSSASSLTFTHPKSTPNTAPIKNITTTTIPSVTIDGPATPPAPNGADALAGGDAAVVVVVAAGAHLLLDNPVVWAGARGAGTTPGANIRADRASGTAASAGGRGRHGVGAAHSITRRGLGAAGSAVSGVGAADLRRGTDTRCRGGTNAAATGSLPLVVAGVDNNPDTGGEGHVAGALSEHDDVLALDDVAAVAVGEDDGAAALEVELALEGLGGDLLVVGGPVGGGEGGGGLVRPAAALLGSVWVVSREDQRNCLQALER